MSKYADIEQIKEVIRTEWVKYMPMELDVNLSFVLGKIAEVPTIEVSEDCISREWLSNNFQTVCENVRCNVCPFNDDDCRLIKFTVDAPSVVPRLDKEDLEDIYEHISESYIEGYMDGQADGVNAIGDCNLCRFAGCSECDDCINGNQWVRMTKEDESK